MVLSGASLLGEVRQTFLQYGTRLGRAGLALQLMYSSVGDIEIRGDEPTPEPLALGSAHDFVAGVTIGLPLPSGAGLGVTVKGIYEKLHLADAFGIAADVGIQMPLPVLNLLKQKSETYTCMDYCSKIQASLLKQYAYICMGLQAISMKLPGFLL